MATIQVGSKTIDRSNPALLHQPYTHQERFYSGPSTPRAAGGALWGILVTNKRLKPSCSNLARGQCPQTSRLRYKAARPFFADITQPLEEQQDNQRDGKRHDDCKCQQQLRERAHGIPPISRKDSEDTARSLIEL